MVFTFLEFVFQDGWFEYFWRSVQPLELKLCELKKESIFDAIYFFFSFLRLYELFNGGLYRPPKVLKLFVLMHRFQICKNNYCRPNGSGDIAFQSVLRKLRQDFWRDKTFVRSCTSFTMELLNIMHIQFTGISWESDFIVDTSSKLPKHV